MHGSMMCTWVLGRIVAVMGHLVVACYLAYRSELVDVSKKASIRSYYMLIWKVFYLG